MTISAAIDMMPHTLAVFGADWDDPTVEDIFVVCPGHYFVRRGRETVRVDSPELDALGIEAIAAYAGHLRGQYADADKPLLDCELPSGERVSIVLPPCTPAGKPSLAIRRATHSLPSLETLEEDGLWKNLQSKLMQSDAQSERIKLAKSMLAAGDVTRFWRYCIAQRWSIGFVGATGSGKTTDATALVMEIPLTDRVITVADTEEWGKLPHPNRVSFLCKKGGNIGMETLIEAALRNGPRWLLVQEVRDGAAFALLRGLASGAPGIFTWHARSTATAFDALAVMIRQHPAGATLPEASLRSMLGNFVDVVAHVERDANGDFRATDISFGRDLI